MSNELELNYGTDVTLLFNIANAGAGATTDGALLGTAPCQFKVPTGYKFHPLYIEALTNDARAGGTCNVKVTKDGTELLNGPVATLDATNTLSDSGLAHPYADPIAAGAVVNVSATTDAGWLPVTADLGVLLIGKLIRAA